MIRFFFTRHELPTLQTPFSSPFKFELAGSTKDNRLPISRLYVTSNHYVDYIIEALGKDHQNKLEELPLEHQATLLKAADFPVDFKNRQFKSVRELRKAVTQVVGDKSEINMVIVNGLGNGLGDNYIGLGALQRLTRLLAPSQVNFHLMQELDQRIAPVYAHQDNVTMHCNVMSVEKFMAMDFYIDFDGIENMPHFDHVPAAHFSAHAFSINQLVPSNNLQAIIRTDSKKSQEVGRLINQKGSANKKTVLVHPLSSTPLRTMPSQKTADIVKALIKEDFSVVSLFAHDNPPEGFIDLSEYCKSVDDLVHVVNAVDAVISVGTVVYHLASALCKPTILLPTVMADIRSAELLPEVKTWLPDKSKNFIQNLHKSNDPKHLDLAKKLWQNIDVNDLAKNTWQHIQSFVETTSGQMQAPMAPKRIAVIVVNTGSLEQLACRLDALTIINGFDPIRLYTIQVREGMSVDLSAQIQAAITDGCDFIWALNSHCEVSPNYLANALRQFDRDIELQHIGDPVLMFLDTSSSSKSQHVSNLKNHQTVIEEIDVFSSTMIRVRKNQD